MGEWVCGMVWQGMVMCGIMWCSVVWYGLVWRIVVWCVVVWCGMVWYGMVWYGMVWYGNGVVRCGSAQRTFTWKTLSPFIQATNLDRVVFPAPLTPISSRWPYANNSTSHSIPCNPQHITLNSLQSTAHHTQFPAIHSTSHSIPCNP